MEELCQPTMLGRGGPIAPMTVQATNFGLTNHMIQQVQQSCQYHGLPRDDANNLMDALTQIPKYSKVLKDLLKDKEKLEELANTPINIERSAILLNKVPEKLGDPGKFLIPYFEADLRVPIILGRPFLRTAKALVDLYEEKLTLRIENEELVFRAEKALRYLKDHHSVHIIDMSILSCDNDSHFKMNQEDLLPPLLVSDSSLHEEFFEIDSLLIFPSGNEDKVFNPGILIRGSTHFVTKIVPDKNLKKKTSYEALLIL
ncbi:hypothetical protein Tco_0645735 [Tanacetum coccineum]